MQKGLSLLLIMLFYVSLAFTQVGDTVLATKNDSLSFKPKGKQYAGLAGVFTGKKLVDRMVDGDQVANNLLLAGSNRFPFNTMLRVINTRNGKSIDVKVVARISKGGSKKNWLMELSALGAKKLGYNQRFLFKIKVQEITLIGLKSNDSIKNNDSTIVIDSLNVVDELSGITYKKTGKLIKGIASFYSANLDGTKTATGEIYRNSKFTAASNNLKLNTWVLVTNLRNNHTVIVRINDRMHPRMAKKGRVVDLSGLAARTLDFVKNGLVKVSVETIQLVNTAIKTVPSTPLDSLSLSGKNPKLVTDSLSKDSLPARENIIADTGITGLAGIYSARSEGAKTANGSIFHHKKLTGASNQFKLNSWVKLTNLKNNKTVILKITDRVSKKEAQMGFIIELSRAVADKIDFHSKGRGLVKVEMQKRPKT